MAASSAKFFLLAVACCAAAARAATPRSTEPPSIDAASSEIDYRNNVAVLHDVHIAQGDLDVRADQATATAADTGPNMENGRWVFKDNVRVKVKNGFLLSNEATVDILEGRIVRALIKGSPATFEQQLQAAQKSEARTARGRAGTIDYDVVGETVRLTDDPYLTDGVKEIRSPTVVYNMREARIVAVGDKQSNERVHIKWTNQKPAPAAKPATSPPPDPKAEGGQE